MSRLVRRHILVVLMVVLAAITVAAAAGQNARELFERARLLETADPQSPDLMRLYEQAAALAKDDRSLAAQALLGLARAQERAGKPEARTTYQRIVDEFASQPGVIVDARARLAALQPPTAGRRPLDPVDADSRLGIFWEPSPDGRFAIDNPGGSSDPGLVLHDLVKGTHRVIVRSESAQARVRGTGVWSPDGRKIAFLWGRTGLPPTGRAQSVEIRIVDIATGENRMLTAKPNVSPPRAMTIRGWTTQDEVVFTLGQQDVFFVAATDGTATTVTLSESSQFGDVVPDGSALVVTGPERMSRFDRKTGTEEVLTRGFEVRSPRVSADGKLIAYFAKQSANWSLRVAPMTGNAIDRSLQIAEVPRVDEMLTRILRWGPDGRLTCDAEVAGNSLYGMRLTSGRARPDAKIERLVHDSWSAGNPVISPDGRLIAYSASKGLAVMNADGSSERLLVEGGFPVGWLSRDEVVFNGSIDEGVFAVSVLTGAVRSIGYDAPVNANAGTGAPQRDAFQYASARNELVFRRFTNDHARFFVRQPGGEERQVLELAILRPGPLPSWRISPRGDRLAYVARRESGSAGGLALHVRNLSNETDKVAGQVGRFPDSIMWTPDGQRLVYNAFTSSGAFEVRQYDVDTGETEIVLDSRHIAGIFPPDARWDVRLCSLSSDRSFVVCAAHASTTHRFAWGGVTLESVMARLGQR